MIADLGRRIADLNHEERQDVGFSVKKGGGKKPEYLFGAYAKALELKWQASKPNRQIIIITDACDNGLFEQKMIKKNRDFFLEDYFKDKKYQVGAYTIAWLGSGHKRQAKKDLIRIQADDYTSYAKHGASKGISKKINNILDHDGLRKERLRKFLLRNKNRNRD